MKRELSDGKFAAILFLIASCFFAVALLTTGCVSSGGPIVVPPPAAKPSPMCVVGVDRFNCWVEPMAGVYQYVCPVKDAAGNVTGTMNASSPTLCPAPMEPPPPPQPPPAAPGEFCTKGRLIGTWHPYLQGLDSTWVCQGDHDFCDSIGYGQWANGTPRYDCPLGADLTPQRNAREKLLGCPAWEWRYDESDPVWKRCTPDPVIGGMSCDAFTLHNVPPYGCEVNTGYFVIPHGKAQIRFRSLKKPEVVSDARWYEY